MLQTVILKLSHPHMSRFVDDKEDVAKLRKCFAGLWSLDDSDIVRKAIESPGSFVMKPQREGGGPCLNFALLLL